MILRDPEGNLINVFARGEAAPAEDGAAHFARFGR